MQQIVAWFLVQQRVKESQLEVLREAIEYLQTALIRDDYERVTKQTNLSLADEGFRRYLGFVLEDDADPFVEAQLDQGDQAMLREMLDVHTEGEFPELGASLEDELPLYVALIEWTLENKHAKAAKQTLLARAIEAFRTARQHRNTIGRFAAALLAETYPLPTTNALGELNAAYGLQQFNTRDYLQFVTEDKRDPFLSARLQPELEIRLGRLVGLFEDGHLQTALLSREPQRYLLFAVVKWQLQTKRLKRSQAGLWRQAMVHLSMLEEKTDEALSRDKHQARPQQVRLITAAETALAGWLAPNHTP